MAGTTVSINLNIRDKGNTLLQQVRTARELNNELDKAAKPRKATVSPPSPQSEQIRLYGQSRGVEARTGASARDFANQAQGLGGVVRLYATWAANMFAVTAAYRALSDAMDTAKMNEGLTSLGGTVGKNILSLARDFKTAAGDAISTKEAMSAAVKAVSSGMSSKDFLRLGAGAKQAASALGLNMSDAVSRLSRAITKLEPELIDELGLFTKVGAASATYAKETGKSVSQLTDFERRTAYKNAVLAELETKFSSINTPTSGFDKLTASLKDVTFELLNVVSKGLNPLLEKLAESPKALTLAIGFLVSKVLKQAVPALTEMRSLMEIDTSRQSRIATRKSKYAARARAVAIDKSVSAKIRPYDEAAEILENEKIQFEELVSARYRKGKLNFPPLVKAAIENKDTSREWDTKELAELKAFTKTVNNRRDKALLNKFYKSIEDSQEGYKYTEDLYTKFRQEANSTVTTARIRQLQREAQAAKRSAISSRIVSRLGETADTQGGFTAFGQLFSMYGFGSDENGRKNVKQNKVSVLGSGLAQTATFAKAAGTIAAKSFLNVASAVASFVTGPLAALAIALPVIDMLFGKNTKQLGEFNNTIATSEDLLRTANKTFAQYGSTVSIDSAIAKNNILIESLSVSKKLAEDYTAVLDNSSFTDNVGDFFKGLFNADVASNAQKAAGDQISVLLKAITDPAAKKKYADAVTELYSSAYVKSNKVIKQNVKDFSSESGRASVLASLSKKDTEKLLQEQAKLAEEITSHSADTVKTLTPVKDSFKSIEDAYLNMEKELNSSSTISKFGTELIKNATAISKALDDSATSATVLADILKNPEQLRFLTPEAVQSLSIAAVEMSKLDEAYTKAVKSGNDQLAENIKLKKSEVVVKVKASLDRDSIGKGVALIRNEANNVIKEAQIKYASSVLSVLPKTKESLAEQLRLDLASIDLKRKKLILLNDLIEVQERNTAQLENFSLSSSLEQLKSSPLGSNETQALRDSKISSVSKALEFSNKQLVATGTPTLKNAPISQEALLAPSAAKLETSIKERSETFKAKLRQLDLEAAAAKVKINAEQIGVEFSNLLENLSNATKEAQLKLENLPNTAAYRSASNEDRLKQTQAAQGDLRELQATKDALTAFGAQGYVSASVLSKNGTSSAARAGLNKSINEANTSSGLSAISLANEKSKDSIAGEELTLENNNKLYQSELTYAENKLTVQKASLDILRTETQNQQELLQLRLDSGTLIKDDYDAQTLSLQKTLDLQTIAVQLNEQELEVIKAKQTYVLAVQNAIKNGTSFDSEQDSFNTAVAAVAEATRNLEIQKTKIQDVDGMYKKLTDTQLKYQEVFKQGFDDMADAIVNFAKTGELSFTSMIDSMLTGLARLAVQQTTNQLFSFMLQSMPWAGASAGASAGSSSLYSLSGSGARFNAMALGGVYPETLHAFANGGSFTNSIVSSPTLFKFASGTGLMGEAGPEAILPLRRNEQGRLGVQSSGTQQNVEVVVNNFSGEKASTKETSDDRGNRKIEVIIGEAVASEIARSNSPVQNNIKRTFGLPPVIRRR